MKKILAILATLCFAACSGPAPVDSDAVNLYEVAPEGEVYTPYVSEDEQLIDDSLAQAQLAARGDLGTAAQPLTIGHRGGTAAPGTRTGNSNLMCTTDSSGQVCYMPRTKNLQWFITTPTGGSCVATANRQAQVRSLVNAWFSALQAQGLDSTWTLTEVAPGTGGVAFAVDVQDGANCTEGFCTSGTTSQVERYSCITGSTSGLVEGTGFAGSYVKWNGGPVLHIDLTQIDNLGTTNTRDANLRRQAVFNGLHRIHGMGQFDGGGNARCISRAGLSNPLTLDAACIVSANEACLMNSFGDTGDQSNLDYVNTNCGT